MLIPHRSGGRAQPCRVAHAAELVGVLLAMTTQCGNCLRPQPRSHIIPAPVAVQEEGGGEGGGGEGGGGESGGGTGGAADEGGGDGGGGLPSIVTGWLPLNACRAPRRHGLWRQGQYGSMGDVVQPSAPEGVVD